MSNETNKAGRPENCNRCNKPKRPDGVEKKEDDGYCNCGRPTKMTRETLDKLDEAFAMGCTDREASLWAGINPTTLYNYQEDNPKFLERKKMLKQMPLLKARRTILDELNDVGVAQWYATKKGKDFKDRHDITSDGEKITGNKIQFVNFDDPESQ